MPPPEHSSVFGTANAEERSIYTPFRFPQMPFTWSGADDELDIRGRREVSTPGYPSVQTEEINRHRVRMYGVGRYNRAWAGGSRKVKKIDFAKGDKLDPGP